MQLEVARSVPVRQGAKAGGPDPGQGVDFSSSSRIILFCLRSIFRVLSALSRRLAGRLALRFFLTPPGVRIPNRERRYYANARGRRLRVGSEEVNVLEWGEGRPVLLVHGWGGRATHLAAFIDPLVAQGYRVVSFDGPAHGYSTGRRADMFEFAAAIAEVASRSGPAPALIGYSFGAACTLLAVSRLGLATGKIVLIACPASAIAITEDFGHFLAISPAAIRDMRERLMHRYGNRWTWEQLAPRELITATRQPVLLIHDTDDREVPFDSALSLREAYPPSVLFSTTGYGHRGVRRAPEAVQKTIEFLGSRP